MSDPKGFEAYETIGIVLPNVTQCPKCKLLINYLGAPPSICPACKALVANGSDQDDPKGT